MINFSHTEIAISIHIISVFDRDYIFKSKQTNLTIYAHLINVDIKTVLIKNNSVTFMKISRNFRLERITKMIYLYIYFVDSIFKNLAMKQLKSSHKSL